MYIFNLYLKSNHYFVILIQNIENVYICAYSFPKNMKLRIKKKRQIIHPEIFFTLKLFTNFFVSFMHSVHVYKINCLSSKHQSTIKVILFQINILCFHLAPQ